MDFYAGENADIIHFICGIRTRSFDSSYSLLQVTFDKKKGFPDRSLGTLNHRLNKLCKCV